MQAIKFCGNCGASASPDADYCRSCGNQLPETDLSVEEKVNLVGWFIGFQGRVNRRGFLLREIIAFSLVFFTELIELIYLVGLSLAFLWAILGLAVMLLGVAVHISAIVRRFHDKGKSGWALLLLLIPFLNIVVWAVLLLASNDGNSNEHGRNPSGFEVGL
tara:strand:+ start:1072 stop:1554 length:483 start_codon:yes stop_codon:yes gene_type:complete